MKQNIIAAILFFSIVANIFGLYVLIMQDNEITSLKANQVTKSEDCSEGKLYTTYSFKDVVIYEPQYVGCEEKR